MLRLCPVIAPIKTAILSTVKYAFNKIGKFVLACFLNQGPQIYLNIKMKK